MAKFFVDQMKQYEKITFRVIFYLKDIKKI
jgi:hypothetical protein